MAREARREPLGERLRKKIVEQNLPPDKLIGLPPDKLVPPPSKPISRSASTAAACASLLLGDELFDAYAPTCFTATAGSRKHPLPTDSERKLVRAALLTSPASWSMQHPRSDTHEFRDGQIRVKHGPAFRWASELGECADSRCGCYRLWRPDVRRRFREIVRKVTIEQLTASGSHRVRYVTVGSGQLLTDFEVLCALTEAGCTIDSVIAIDTCYAVKGEVPIQPSSSPTNDATEKDRPAVPNDTASAALAQIASFFSPANVFAFSSLERYVDAVRLEPHLYAHATTLVQCDAGDVPAKAMSEAAVDTLAAGGHMFKLNNLGLGTMQDDKQGENGGGHDANCASSAMSHDRKTHRQFWRAQLRDSSSIEAWRRLPGSTTSQLARFRRSEALMSPLDPTICQEVESEKQARHGCAKMILTQSNHQRAAALSLSVYRVVFTGAPASSLQPVAAANGNGQTATAKPRNVPIALRDTVAVRAAPSRSAPIVATRKRGDEMLIAEERDGWVRLSEEDDEWGWHLSFASDRTPREAWMLVDATDVGLGRLLERTTLKLETSETFEHTKQM
mmetsp:Transcript_14152/g.23547  ORF Transcript_14152/g.23547 Transcript_14152/m.23547 type:complete len:563 (-) Transcript_14152:205-1893(-)|eukprot:CAMPEP_0119300992 /NCGR_PEP_ID=MMETSP1333-20130426/2863_1 /TAXON_ID=418940 /ORGANISM="Scyphosphaera apsteinii, Strain RCC1455" /LENGTH=562 /DNA_ID=CAMNT_0007302955 /DNA_START=157 /DNA_END=1845 /DNA_ORIENTATION=-